MCSVCGVCTHSGSKRRTRCLDTLRVMKGIYARKTVFTLSVVYTGSLRETILPSFCEGDPTRKTRIAANHNTTPMFFSGRLFEEATRSPVKNTGSSTRAGRLLFGGRSGPKQVFGLTIRKIFDGCYLCDSHFVPGCYFFPGIHGQYNFCQFLYRTWMAFYFNPFAFDSVEYIFLCRRLYFKKGMTEAEEFEQMAVRISNKRQIILAGNPGSFFIKIKPL